MLWKFKRVIFKGPLQKNQSWAPLKYLKMHRVSVTLEAMRWCYYEHGPCIRKLDLSHLNPYCKVVFFITHLYLCSVGQFLALSWIPDNEAVPVSVTQNAVQPYRASQCSVTQLYTASQCYTEYCTEPVSFTGSAMTVGRHGGTLHGWVLQTLLHYKKSM